MAQSYSTISTYISTNIIPNGTNSITGTMMNTILGYLATSIAGYCEYDSTRTYEAGKHICYYSTNLYMCIATATGAFDGSKWQQLTWNGYAGDERTGTTSGTKDTPNAITFATSYGSTNYIYFINCYDASGNNVDYNVSSKAATGFTVTPAANCTIEYLVKFNAIV